MAAAPPVVVTSPQGNPSDSPIHFSANADIVASLSPIIEFGVGPPDAAGNPQVELKQCLAVETLVPKATISKVPIDLTASQARNPLTMALTDGTWSRIITELTASGLFAVVYSSVLEWYEALKTTALITPSNMQLAAGDWRNITPWSAPAGVHHDAYARLRFLTLISPDSLEDPTSPLPLARLCRLVAALGACHSQAARREEMGGCQLTAELLRTHIGRGTALSDGALASRVGDVLAIATLPPSLQSRCLVLSTARRDLADSLAYRESAEGRVRVELSRLSLLDSA